MDRQYRSSARVTFDGSMAGDSAGGDGEGAGGDEGGGRAGVGAHEGDQQPRSLANDKGAGPFGPTPSLRSLQQAKGAASIT